MPRQDRTLASQTFGRIDASSTGDEMMLHSTKQDRVGLHTQSCAISPENEAGSRRSSHATLRRILGATIAVAAALSGTVAKAQQFSGYGPAYNGFAPVRIQPGDRVPLRIQVQYQIQLPSDRNATIDDQKGTIETGHAALYELARRECDTLQKAFEGDCRVVALNVGNMTQNFGPSTAAPMNATATIEIVPRQPAPSAPPVRSQ